jgi:hypothetical protein
MMQTRLWKPLKAIVKIYGMARLGVICACIGCLIVLCFVSVMWSVAGAIPGYFIGDYLAKSLHDGKAQRFIRWHFGFGVFGRGISRKKSTRLFF